MPYSREEQEKIAQLGRYSLIDFSIITLPGYRPSWHHEELARELEAVERGECRRLIVMMPPRHGKQIGNNVPVLTNKGWKKHGEIEVGDFVFAPNGKMVAVSAVSSETAQNCEVFFSSGEKIEAHENHEWIVYDRAVGRQVILSTKKIEERVLEIGTPGRRGHRYTLQIIEREPLEMEEKRLVINPYVLGVWLGDGSTGKNCITYCEKDKSIIERCAEIGYRPTTHNTHKKTGVHTDYIKRLYGELKKLDLLGNKHIPDSYLLSSLKQRKELMAGLIDTDGHTEKNGRVRFSTCSEKLRDDVFDLATSLGANVYFTTTQPHLSTSGIQGKKRVYQVCFHLPFTIPTILERKRNKTNYKRRRRAIVSVKRGKEVFGKCIRVEGGVYLVGKTLIPTHNSELATIRFPAWYLGLHPTREVITACHTAELALDFGGKTRDIVSDPVYRYIFPEGIALKADEQARAKWRTNKGGSYTSVGVGGPLTGRGADLLILDDVFKNREEADSATIRDKIWSWYLSTAYTRLEKDAAIVLVLTHWHLDDIAGRILARAEETGEKWRLIKFPAIATADEPNRKAGEALWSEEYPLEVLEMKKATLGPYEWGALYQQMPILTENQEFRREWFLARTMEEVRALDTRNFLTIDTAYSAKESADYVGLCRNYVDRENKWNLRGGRMRLNPRELADLIFRWQDEDHFEKIGIEKTAYLIGLKPFLEDEQRKRGKFLPIVELHHHQTQKETRIRGLIPRYSSNSIYHIKGECGALEEELLTFPQAIYDDASDACAYQLQIAADGSRGGKNKTNSPKIIRGRKGLRGT